MIGRGKPVDRAVLEASGAVSSTFIDDVTELADELDSDAEALLRELRERNDERAKGFRTAKANDLEEYLRVKGYLDPDDPLSPDSTWQHMLADLTTERSEGDIDASDLERLFDRVERGPSH